jgi:hypothetical protein
VHKLIKLLQLAPLYPTEQEHTYEPGLLMTQIPFCPHGLDEQTIF